MKLKLGNMERKSAGDDNAFSIDCTSQNDDTECPPVPTLRDMTVEVSCTSGNCAEGTSVEASSSHELASSSDENKIASERNSGDAELVKKSSERVYSTQLTSIKSDVSSETGPTLKKNRKELGNRGAAVSRIIEEGFKLKTEFSSSNSSNVILSGSSQSKSHENVSTPEAKSSKNCITSSKAPECRAHAVEFPQRTSGGSSIDDVSCETVRISSIDSVDAQKGENLKETAGQIKSSMLLCSEFTEQSQDSPSLLATESRDDLKERDPSQIAPNTGHVATTNQSPHLHDFDLNEDMGTTEEVACPEQTSSESVSTFKKMSTSEPIAVVAKIGVPIGLPRAPLQFDGELGWRSAATSAFQPAKIKISRRNKITSGNCKSLNAGHSLNCRGIDLNIDISADNWATESTHNLVPSHIPAKKFSVDVGSKRVILDLNCQSENDDKHPKSGILGFDLNDKLSVEDTYNDLYQSGQSCQLSINSSSIYTGGSSKGPSRQSNYDSMTPAYLVDLSSMPGFNHVQAQPLIVAASGVFTSAQQMHTAVPLQSRVAFNSPALPGIYAATASGLSTMYSPIILPHLSGQNAAIVVPPMSGSILAAYPRNLHLLQSTQRSCPNGYKDLRPSFLLGSGVTSFDNGNYGENTKDFLVPARNTLVDERTKSSQQVALPPTSLKRREPEGGWDACNLTLDGLSHGTRTT
ncbi:hypothetical protein Nepgr_002181 [Nepenthes gracilis]|uniref:Uncharacterized protein n=1 Tax=Nepenthes gracilis TaxID=150966 RepID=A0AAD3P6L6_NEPGR|nr:hypothetical protein Nepgr_002181 [Nepenthes gracilis]